MTGLALLGGAVPVTGRAQALPPDEGDPATALFRRPRVMPASQAFRAYQESKPIAVATTEFLSAGFLTEDQDLPAGRLLGPVVLEQSTARAMMQRFSRVALSPPQGMAYGVGDSVLVVEQREAPAGYGKLLVPTAVARVVQQNGDQAVAEIVALYGTVRAGQLVTALPRFSDPGRVEPKPVSDGIEGRVLLARNGAAFRLPQQLLFIDVGRAQGVQPGDIFEARTSEGSANDAGIRSLEMPLATLRVVHVGERSAAVKVVNVFSIQLSPGTRVRQVATIAQ